MLTDLLIVALLMLLNGLLAMAELAVVSSRRARLEAMRGAGAQAALRLLEAPGRFLGTVQIGITLVGVLAGDFQGVHVDGARNVAQAAARTGAAAVVHLSAIGADPVSPSNYGRTKGEGEDAVRRRGVPSGRRHAVRPVMHPSSSRDPSPTS